MERDVDSLPQSRGLFRFVQSFTALPRLSFARNEISDALWLHERAALTSLRKVSAHW